MSRALKLKAVASRWSPYWRIGEALAKLFPADSRPARLLEASSEIQRVATVIVDYFADREVRQWPRHASATLRNGIERYGELVALVHEPNYERVVYALGEHVVTWELGGMANWFSSTSTMSELAHELLARAAAELGNGPRLAMTPRGFEIDIEQAPSRPTAAVEEICRRLRVELGASHRTLLLHGPPGSGKTAASRQLAEALCGQTLIITTEMFASPEDQVYELAAALAPDCIIIDDVDHILRETSSAGLLAGVSKLRASVRLVIATANVVGSLPGALQRPGRFDRVERFERMDDAVARTILASTPTDVREKAVAEGLMGAYLTELDFRCATGDDPARSLDELLERQRQAGDGLESHSGVRRSPGR